MICNSVKAVTLSIVETVGNILLSVVFGNAATVILSSLTTVNSNEMGQCNLAWLTVFVIGLKIWISLFPINTSEEQ